MIDCQSCGACCKALPDYTGNHYVRMMPEELDRLTAAEQLKYTAPTSVEFAKSYGMTCGTCIKSDGTCAALSGEVGKQVSCDIYANRPNICRVFEPESDPCLLARYEAGISEWED